MFMCFMFPFELFCVFFVFTCVVVDCKCKSLKRLGEHIHKTERNITNNLKRLKEKHKNKQKYRISSPRPPRINRINHSRRFVGWKSCISVCFMFFFEFLCCFYVSFCFFLFLSVSFCLCFLFSPSLFKLLHLQSKNICKHIE